MNYFYVYILKCVDGSYYTGHTDNLEKRLSEHQQGLISGYTSQKLPVELVYHAVFGTRDEAFFAERKIKGWNRKKKKALINNDWHSLKMLSNK